MPSEIPAGWTQVPLAELVTKVRNGTAAAQTNEPVGPPVSRIETIAEGAIDFSRVRYLLSWEGLSDYLLRPGDILFSHINSVAHIAKSAIYLGPRPIYHGMNLLMLRPNPQRVLPQFVHSTLQLEPTRRYFRAHCKKAINQASLNTGDVVSLPVLLPPLPEQKKIAAILSSVDEAIQAKRAVIEQTRRVKEGMLQDLLTRGIGHTRFKQTEIGEIPEGWNCGTVGDLVSTMKSGLSRRLQSEDIGVAVLISGNLQDGTLATGDLKYWYESDPQGADVSAYILNDGDLLLCFINSISQIGKVCVFRDIGRPAIYTTNLFRIIPSLRCTSEFLHALISSQFLQHQIQVITKPAVNQASFTKPDFLRIRVPIPTLNEQAEIVAALHEVDKAIEGGGRKLDSLVLVKAGLLQDLLTGKVRVTA